MLKTTQKNQQFIGIKPYKAIGAIILSLFLLICLFGPFLFSHKYQIICLSILTYAFFRSVFMLIQSIIGYFKGRNILRKTIKNKQKKESDKTQKPNQISQIYHAIVIPNYKEDIELLMFTLEQLACQPLAKSNYIIFLAMEDSQLESVEKAEFLISKFQRKFMQMYYTVHKLQQNEDRMKSSNSNWALERMKNMLGQNFPMQNVYITSIDADSILHEVYFSQINEYLQLNPQNKHKTIFSSPHMFYMNLNQPIVCRTASDIHSNLIFQNMGSVFYPFPMSNYSVSFKLLEEIGFLDTCKQAIGQDLHIVIKTHWKKNGDITVIPIYVPSLQRSIQTNQGTLADIKAKFWQMYRHGQGCTEMSYCIKMLVEKKKNWKILDFVLTFVLIEMYLMPFMVFVITLSYFMGCEYINKDQLLISKVNIALIFNILAIIQMCSHISCFFFKKNSMKYYFNQPTEPIMNLLIHMTLGVLIFGLFSTLALVAPVFTTAIIDNLTYFNSVKSSGKKKDEELTVEQNDSSLKKDL